MYRKVRTTIYPDGRKATVINQGTAENVVSDMTATREDFTAFRDRMGILTIAETTTTLVVVRDNGTVHVINWVSS